MSPKAGKQQPRFGGRLANEWQKEPVRAGKSARRIDAGTCSDPGFDAFANCGGNEAGGAVGIAMFADKLPKAASWLTVDRRGRASPVRAAARSCSPAAGTASSLSARRAQPTRTPTACCRAGCACWAFQLGEPSLPGHLFRLLLAAGRHKAPATLREPVINGPIYDFLKSTPAGYAATLYGTPKVLFTTTSRLRAPRCHDGRNTFS